MILLWSIGLLLVNLFWLFVVVLGLPGNWLMVASAAAMSWWLGADSPLGTAVLVGAAGLALAGEIAEFFVSAAGAKKAGGSTWGSIGSILGAIVGGLLGTGLIPIPVIGSILGACLGAFAGALALEMLTGRGLGRSIKSGKGAAVGRFWGTVAKLAAGVAIWVTIAVALFV